MYPEHDKLSAIQDQSRAVGEFLDWLGNGEAGGKESIILAHNPLITTRFDKDSEEFIDLDSEEYYRSTHLVPYNVSIPNLLAKFFEIDLNKLEKEKCQMLAECRKKT